MVGVVKTDEQILDIILSDTRSGNLLWKIDRDIRYSRYSFTHNDSNKIDLIFKLSEDLMEDEDFDHMYYNFSMENITLDIYLSKNNKKEFFCKRIFTFQYKLNEIMRISTIKMGL